LPKEYRDIAPLERSPFRCAGPFAEKPDLCRRRGLDQQMAQIFGPAGDLVARRRLDLACDDFAGSVCRRVWRGCLALSIIR